MNATCDDLELESPDLPEPAEPAGAAAEASAAENRRWRSLSARIRDGEPAALDELYQMFVRGIRFFLSRQLSAQELDDRVHDTFLIVVQAIQRGDVRQTERLGSFIRTVVRRQAAMYIGETAMDRRDRIEAEPELAVLDSACGPEELVIRDQQAELMQELLQATGRRDREILTRFYIDEEPVSKICAEMGLSHNQFRLLKSRAKARFCQMGRRKFGLEPLPRPGGSEEAPATGEADAADGALDESEAQAGDAPPDEAPPAGPAAP